MKEAKVLGIILASIGLLYFLYGLLINGKKSYAPDKASCKLLLLNSII